MIWNHFLFNFQKTAKGGHGGKQYYGLFFDADGRPRLREAPPEAETSASTNDEKDDTAEESPEVDAPAGTAAVEAAQ